MDTKIQPLEELIAAADNILVTSHISPDTDAVSSILLLGSALRLNYPKKRVTMVLEEEPTELDFLDGYSQIIIKPILQTLKKNSPDLFILLDGNSYERASRHDGQQVRDYVAQNSLKSVLIDHHEEAGRDNADIYINDNCPATVQNVYQILFKVMNLKKPKGYAQTTMAGLFSDTGGFVYMKDGTHKEVFSLASELVEAGAVIENIKNQLYRFQDGDMQILSELASNTMHGKDYTYSYLKDETVAGWINDGSRQIDLQRPVGSFLDEYIRNIGGRTWGFIVYKNTIQGENYYSVSLRALSGTKDVSAIANSLGGGGHKPAAGAKFEAKNVHDAIEKVEKAISLSATS